MICKQGIPGGPISVVTADEEEIYESESEYHDAMSDLRELTKGLDINKDHKDLKPVFIGTKCINDEIEKYQEPLINKLGLSWAKLSPSWGFKLEVEVEV